MKVLVVGDGVKIYSSAFAEAFKILGCQVSSFVWSDYFKNKDNYNPILNKFQNKFLFGPILKRINSDLIELTQKFKPDLVFIYRGQYIYPYTLEEIKTTNTIVFGYHNDDPFKKGFKLLNSDRHFLKGLKYYDWVFSYRSKNILDYKRIGYHNTSLLRSYYLKNDNFFIEQCNDERFICDIIFIGHWEDDGRDIMILSLVLQGFKVKVFGTEWQKSKLYSKLYHYFGNIIPLRGEDYNIAINSSKIALVFLSKLNKDTYTRRCFEIPATKTFMLAEFTNDLNSLFKEGIEADYFRNKDELILKVKKYLGDSVLRTQIADNGYNRLIKDGHESLDRVKEIMKKYNRLCQ